MNAELLTNGQVRPLGLDRPPVFSWRGDIPFRQTAYRVIVRKGTETVWDSGLVAGTDSQWIRAGFTPESRTAYSWSVTLADESGVPHDVGETCFETGLLNESDWTAAWIGAGRVYRANWALYFRRAFTVSGKVARARLYFSGLGIGVPHLNGRRVGDHRLDPAQTEYPQKVFYSVYDVTDALKEGENCLGAELGDGWYSQNQLMEGGGVYGLPCLRAQLEITYADGRSVTVSSDPSFRVSLSPTVYNNIYIGETYDARCELPGWDLPGYDDSAWAHAVPDTVPKGKMTWQFLPPMRVTREIKPAAILKPQAGVEVYDFGENLTGVVRLKVKGKPGNVVRIRFAEAVDENGMIDVDSSGVFHIRGVQTLTYVFGDGCKGGEQLFINDEFVYTGGTEGEWTPEFCYFGFRYAELTGVHDRTTVESLTALKIHTDFPDSSSFFCDMPILNTMEQLLRRTMPNNAQGLPTDCPAREKCGWTGDANVISEAALLMWDSRSFFEKYTEDIIECHRTIGIWVNVNPGKRSCLDTVPAWGTAVITIPWRVYKAGGDRSVLERYYGEMAAYGRYMLQESTDGVYKDHIYKLADWAAPYGYQSASHFFQISAMYMFFAFTLLSESAAVLGLADDAAFWAGKAAMEKEVCIRLYYDAEAHTYGTQTLNAFADELGLIPDGEGEAAADWTERDILAHDSHITCGHIGIRYIYRYLHKYGRTDTLAAVLNSRTYPSFGAQLDAGATSLWETFELNTHDQSLDHPFRGSYCVWLYEDVLGVRALEPGFRRFSVDPRPGLVSEVRGHLDTPYGRISVDRKDGDHLTVTVPWNTEADVTLPDGTVRTLTPGTYELI
ncbi:MAG: glycoside hydrolase family 78 protein [Clostridia bacterium]|nr:glycoside hydrolase family 78 protein [Clostridia bacterium]